MCLVLCVSLNELAVSIADLESRPIGIVNGESVCRPKISFNTFRQYAPAIAARLALQYSASQLEALMMLGIEEF